VADVELDMGNLLLDCLREQFLLPIDGLDDIPDANFCLIPGTEIAEDVDPMTGVDLCCDGLGWVRIGDSYPSSDFPNPDEFSGKCFPVQWAQTYEVGILGCYNSSVSLTCAQKSDYATADAQRIKVLKQVACCFGRTLEGNPKTRGRLWQIQSITVEGPRGGCISRVMSLVVQLPRCC
jgi:hypothetical protein